MDASVELESSRLLLRRFKSEDEEMVVRLMEDGFIYENTLAVPYPYSGAHFKSFLGIMEESRKKDSGIHFAIVLKETQEVIGNISLVRKGFPKRFYEKPYPVAAIGYWVGKDYGNKGYCTEACKRLLTFAFQEEPDGWGLRKVKGSHFDFNPASGKVMAKLGMKKEGTLREEMWKKDSFKTTIEYGILRHEWIAMNDT